jgi:hypothetical protein
MSMGSRIRRVTARVALLFAILSSINLIACALALGQALSQISGTVKVKESRHDDLRREITSDATPPSATTALEVPVLTPDRPWDGSPVGIC